MKRILLVTDVFGWGGHERARMIKENLSDTYEFDIVDSEGLTKHVDEKLFGDVDIQKFFKRKNFSTLIKEFEDEKELYITSSEDIDDFVYRRIKALKGVVDTRKMNNYKMKDFMDYLNHWSKRRRRKSIIPIFINYLDDIRSNMKFYDLYYLMFHSMLKRHDVKKLIENGQNIVSVVTGFPTLRKGMFEDKNEFWQLSRKTRAIFANNIKSLQDLRMIYKGPTYYVPRGVDPNIFYPKRYDKKNFTVSYVGKPVDEKGLESIIKPACKQANVRLITNTRNYTNALSPKDMCNFYNNSNVYVVASTIDGTPNPALEAAACGRPIISNEIGNMPQFIEDNVNGFLIKRSIERYVRKISWLRDNVDRAEEMGMKARETILAGWTWKHIAKYERDALKEVLRE